MPIFTAIAAFVSAAVGGGLFGAIAGFAARTLLTIGITRLIANRTGTNAAGTQDVGSRVHVPPGSNNKLPVVYGTAYMGSTVTDMKISDDGKKMWYVCSISEVTNTMPTQTPDTMTFGDIYWGGKKVIFGDGGDTSKVTSLETNSDPIQVDDKVNGKIHMYRFPYGSASGIDTGASDAITIMSDSDIPADLRWNSALYTTGGQSASMTNVAFIIVKVDYDQNAGTTGLVPLNVQITNSRHEPGDVIYDYMYNNVYGCAIPLANIDTASLSDLNAYSVEQINYLDNGSPATQDRYQINGPIQTGNNCLANLQQLADACDSWLQYSELDGKWKMVINKPYDGVIGDLYQVTDSNLMSGINVNPIDLNGAYNILEVQFPNTALLDKTDYAPLKLVDYVPEVMSYNEPENQLVVQFPQVNNYVQAVYLGERRILQSREDLVIDFALDYSGIQIEAGDVITVKFTPYGWDDDIEFPDGKLFRVSSVQEAKIDDGTLGVKITAFEYNNTIYANNPFEDFVPEINTGLKNPSISNNPGTPVFATNTLANSGAVTSFSMTSTVPSSGTIIAMDFNLGNTSNISTHKLYSTVNAADGIPFTNSQSLTININDQKIGNYYGSVTARTIANTGYVSNVGGPFAWGANLQANSVTYTNMSNSVVALTSLASYGYTVGNSFDNTYVLPVNVNTFGNVTTGNWDAPKFINTSYFGGGGLYPYYDGNATTAMGYLVNSTGVLTPGKASAFTLNNGDLAWYVLEYKNFTPQIVSTTEQLNLSSRWQAVADTDNTILQIVSFLTYTTNPGVIIVDTQAMGTYILMQGVPTRIEFVGSNFGATIVNGGGFLMRTLSPGARVDFILGGLTLTKQKL